MKIKKAITDFLMSFFCITACITILTAVLGTLYMPDVTFTSKAFFSPVIFGFLSALTGYIVKSKNELSTAQLLFRMLLQLLCIEIIVFGLNYLAGNSFETSLNISLALSIALVYAIVHIVLWLNDQRNANVFNQQLAEFQRRNTENDV